jgi:hypothetical protein
MNRPAQRIAELRRRVLGRLPEVERLNEEGILRADLMWALTQRRMVYTARRINRCLLCRRAGVNEAGVCDVCNACLTEDEQRLVEGWLRGTGP